ncbi:MAG: cysteine--tRNA ligase [Acidimicrobiales bacterium]
MLRLFDSAVGSVVDVQGNSGGAFSIYNCGPTVYDLPHLGHGRAVLTFDILRRYLESVGVDVRHVSNVTDIDDKIIARAKERGADPREIAAQYEEAWWKTTDLLGALRPHEAPHATEWIDQMVDIVSRLLGSGVAYRGDDGVYLEVEKVEGYGLLAQQPLADLRHGARVEAASFKRSPLDFVLWKFVSSDEIGWATPLGYGRPGWHTECVAMSTGLFGHTFDLHGGGLDLRFPHHENERAQSVALGYPFARHWMHHGFVEVGGAKMSKSLGNFVTMEEMVEKFDPRSYRLLVARAHYRSPLEVTSALAEDAVSTLARLDRFSLRLHELVADDSVELCEVGVLQEFHREMRQDLNTPVALANLFRSVTEANTAFDLGEWVKAKSQAVEILSALTALGLVTRNVEGVPLAVVQRAQDRQRARESGDWGTADRLRSEIAELGYLVEDGPQGFSLRRSDVVSSKKG